MANFNSGKSLFLVIQCVKANYKDVLALLDKNAFDIFGRGRYAYILHDKDALDDGSLKNPHIHIAFTATEAMSSNNWIKFFSEKLKVEKDAVSVEMQGSEKKCVRYLLHLDDGDKHQYERSAVVTNMADKCAQFWTAGNGYVSNPTLEQLTEAAKEGVRGVYNLVGMNAFKKACDVLDRIGAEDTRYAMMTQEIQRLYDDLCALAVSKDALTKGYISLKDYQSVLERSNETLNKLLAVEKARLELGKKK